MPFPPPGRVKRGEIRTVPEIDGAEGTEVPLFRQLGISYTISVHNIFG